MTIQDVRGAIAKLTSDALVAAGIPFADQHWDNVGETPGKDAAGTYAVINISVPQLTEETIGCEGVDAILGSVNVLLYTPKGQGMKPAEDTLLTVTKAWIAENAKRGSTTTTTLRVRNINGPNGLAPDQRPHQVTSLSAAFTARVP
jgi:hypothetical protein